MFEPRSQSRLIAVLVGLALGGCAYQRAEPIATGPWAEISAATAATPVASPPRTAYLGAGDSFGQTLYRQYLASLQDADQAVAEASAPEQPSRD